MADRRRQQPILAGLRPLAPLAVVWGIGYSLLIALARQRTVPHEALLLDPASYGGLPWYAGLVSNLGVLGWTTGAVAAAGGAWVATLGRRRGPARLLGQGALLTALLMLDDLFQLHITVPHALGLPKTVFYLGYMVLATAWVLANGPELRRTRWLLLAAAATTFLVSIGVDQYGARSGVGLVAEDGFKFLGILAWTTYFVITAGDITRSVVGHGPRPEPSPSGDEGPSPQAQSLLGQ